MSKRTKNMALTAVMAALICAAGPLTIPVGPIPLTLANFMIFLSGAVLGAKQGAIATAIYLLIGGIGMPVFSGFSGGIHRLIGVTGGFLLAYVPCAFIAGLGTQAGETRPRHCWRLPACIVLGAAVLYAFGTVWFIVYKTWLLRSPTGLAEALAVCVIPFLLGDAIKIAVTTLLAWPIRRALYR